ncbi:MAG TPA: T9SS type A sorting domain-containing protein [Bacteroidales bacterium]|nr:T9SS type A sorting domain-containing protein [Bacteroidales bacterium]HOL96873.1 T9SS type A sorting domain-containing protein [Bacteroidales bacterium]HOM36846.1 T9SS type A sorting domain-containing protein [Bacteroidales bacterium]HPD24317.1 T9SS type A sorting domain-containing protein [Bacteroidales bacterium]HRS98430.1 T9SS type A sorting domain-containing protein [Bacteroidales bacterium]
MPQGEYECIRVKSTIITRDTIFMEQYGFGILAPPRTSYEYKWLTNNFKIPIIQIIKENMISSAKYITVNDAPNNKNNIITKTSFETLQQNNNLIIKLSGNSEPANVFVFDISGKLFYSENLIVSESDEISISKSIFPNSMYIIKAQIGKDIYIEKVIIE